MFPKTIDWACVMTTVQSIHDGPQKLVGKICKDPV